MRLSAERSPFRLLEEPRVLGEDEVTVLCPRKLLLREAGGIFGDTVQAKNKNKR